MPYGITQCYLPPARGDIPAFTPAKAGTRFSDHGGMQGWVDARTGASSMHVWRRSVAVLVLVVQAAECSRWSIHWRRNFTAPQQSARADPVHIRIHLMTVQRIVMRGSATMMSARPNTDEFQRPWTASVKLFRLYFRRTQYGLENHIHQELILLKLSLYVR